MFTLREDHGGTSRPRARPARQRSRWFSAGRLLAAGGVAAGIAGLPVTVSVLGAGGPAEAQSERPTMIAASDNHAVQSVPCDSDQLIAALAHANAVGGGDLELAPGCTYTLSKVAERYRDPNRQDDGDSDETSQSSQDSQSEQDGDSLEEKSGLPVIYHPISVKGSGATIVRDAAAEEFRFFTVADGGELRLSDVTLQNGREAIGGGIRIAYGGTAVLERTTITQSTAFSAEAGGGAIFSDGYLTVDGSKFTHNTAVGPTGRGGGILNGGVLTVTKTEFTENSAGAFGGGFANLRGAADIRESTFVGNHAAEGGGIASVSARTKVWDTQVTGNTAKTGGGIANRDATLTLWRLTVSHNASTVAGGGVSTVQGLLTVDDSEINANATFGDGGGVLARESNLIVRGSEIGRNHAVGTSSTCGGVLVETGQVSIFRSRVVNNNATGQPGGGTARNAKVTIDDETVITGNTPTDWEGSQQSRLS